MRKNKINTKSKLTKKNIKIDDIVFECLSIIVETMSKAGSETLDAKFEFAVNDEALKNDGLFNIDLKIEKVKKSKMKKV